MEKNRYYSEGVERVLHELYRAMYKHEKVDFSNPEYTDKSLFYAIEILAAVAGEHMYHLQMDEKMEHEAALKMADSFGTRIYQIIKTYTGKDLRKIHI